ncbi:hypothetical protein H1C71_035632, partial [Ictidomys tridecemlineatus]
ARARARGSPPAHELSRPAPGAGGQLADSWGTAEGLQRRPLPLGLPRWPAGTGRSAARLTLLSSRSVTRWELGVRTVVAKLRIDGESHSRSGQALSKAGREMVFSTPSPRQAQVSFPSPFLFQSDSQGRTREPWSGPFVRGTLKLATLAILEEEA